MLYVKNSSIEYVRAQCAQCAKIDTDKHKKGVLVRIFQITINTLRWNFLASLFVLHIKD